MPQKEHPKHSVRSLKGETLNAEQNRMLRMRILKAKATGGHKRMVLNSGHSDFEFVP